MDDTIIQPALHMFLPFTIYHLLFTRSYHLLFTIYYLPALTIYYLPFTIYPLLPFTIYHLLFTRSYHLLFTIYYSPTLKTSFPNCARSSISSCARRASASGNVWSTTARIFPVSTNFIASSSSALEPINDPRIVRCR
jgi:hypothetical protein